MNPPLGLSSELLWWLLQLALLVLGLTLRWQMGRLLTQFDAHDARVRTTQEKIAGLTERVSALADDMRLVQQHLLGTSGD